MKKNYLFFTLFVIVYSQFQGQTDCSDADTDLIFAYSHVKSSYDSKNISQLKYYAKKSLESFESAKPKLKDCGCKTAYKNANDSAELLSKAETSKTFEDGLSLVKKARDIAKQSIIELDKCSAPYPNNDALAALKMEQDNLKQQQNELKIKEEQIKLKIAELQEKELQSKKESLINSYKNILSSNVKVYNETLKICDCKNYEVLTDINDDPENLYEKSLSDIKIYYLSSIKELTSNYLTQLKLCDE